jgi:F0F1-type ATP synthase membrane subunit b/b'
MADLAKLNAALEWWDWVAYVSTGFVLVGVVGETITGLFELIKDSRRSKLVEKASALVLIVGLVGELVSQGKLSRISGQMSDDVSRQVAAANASAADAKERTATAESTLAEAKSQAAMASQKAAEAGLAAESERLARVKLEAQIAPRRLSAEQRGAVAAACKRFVGRTIAIQSYSIDVEGRILGQQIADALREAGLVVRTNLAGLMPIGPFQTGIHIHGSSADADLAMALMIVLKQQGGLDVEWPHTAKGDPGEVSVTVAAKPAN